MRDAAAAVARSVGLALMLATGVAGAAGVPLPAPRPALPPPAPEPATVPLPVPRPEEDGPQQPPSPTQRELFGPALPSHAPGPAIVPLPASRPEEDGPPQPPGPAPREVFGPALPPAPPPPPAPPEPDLACGPLLAGGTVVAHAAPPVSGLGGCGIASPVTLEAVVLRDGRRVPLEPPALMRCDLAQVVADWLRDDIVPATAAEGSLLGIADAAAYTCRPRNSILGGRLSEHGRGNAIDVLAFRFAKRTIGLKGGDARDTITAIRAAACARFATVLGPGADRFHETDLHLDLEHRRNGFKLCQWDLP